MPKLSNSKRKAPMYDTRGPDGPIVGIDSNPLRVDKLPHDLEEENLRNVKTTIVIPAVTLRGYVESQLIRECSREASLDDVGDR